MSTAVKAKYNQGVFKPLRKIDLPNGLDVVVHIETPEDSFQDRLWLEDTAQEMADRVAGIEADLPQDEVAQWHKSMARVARPAQYIEGRGVVTKRL